ncbi:MAG TPA: sodium:proton antiporter [Thermodesulfobacteriota bacterium]|nr:sodium:proton antiporter [Thermodesulfobacteriota bacterium]
MENLGQILPFWSVSFFVLLLLCIAILPLVHSRFWDSNRNKSIVCGILSLPVVLLFYHYDHFQPLLYEIKEYFSFIILLASLFIISGGIFLSGDIEATPRNNAIFLLIGGIIANIFGTTGAAMLLIRPVLRTNSERQFIAHIPVFFIFIICNIGGCLTPLGDPPLFMGYLRGVPFFWTLRLFPHWIFMMTLILIVFYCVDLHFWKRESQEAIKLDREMVEPLSTHGKINIIFIIGVLLSVIFLDTPIREGVMIGLSVLSLISTPKKIRERNEFHFAPIIEVAILFAAIFITMVPALLILEARGGEFGVRLPWHFFWTSGGLSSFLDNTPTYVTFVSLAQGLAQTTGLPKEMIGIPVKYLEAISVGAVFMGANSYIGNGPNFMVKVICEHQKVKIPSFFGYMLWSCGILVPLFIIVTFVFFV